MTLFTRDEDGTRIEENASIEKFESLEALKQAVVENPSEVEEGEFYISDVREGSFADCWIKTNSLECQESWIDEVGMLNIRRDHPGTHKYWVDPANVVYVPVWTEKE